MAGVLLGRFGLSQAVRLVGSGFSAWSGADVEPFTLGSKQDEQFDRLRSGAAEPVWGMGVELGDFAGFHDQVEFTEAQP